MKILLLVCCAPDATYSTLALREAGYDVITYFYNPCIHPQEEYDRRRAAMALLAEKMNIEDIKDVPYDPERFFEAVKGFENEPEGAERCDICFKLRLLEAARKCKELGLEIFASTLTISPHKNAALINALGKEAAEHHGVKYYESDFKKKDGFKKSITMSKEFGLYRQNYCGCEFSIRK